MLAISIQWKYCPCRYFIPNKKEERKFGRAVFGVLEVVVNDNRKRANSSHMVRTVSL